MKSQVPATVGLVTLLLTSGCFATTGVNQQETQDLEAHIQTLNQRVDRLETSRGGSPAVAATPATGAYESAQEGASVDETGPARFSAGGAFGKLARGFTNLVTGWVEIPKRIQETTGTSGAFAGWTWGIIRGIGYGFVRTAGGAYETVTFPFPAPSEYQPIIRPTFVFSADES